MLNLDIQENISLRPYNTFGLEAKARFFVEIVSVQQLQLLLQKPDYQDIPKLILGGGSNMLLLNNFEGLVIKIDLKGKQVIKQTQEHVFVKVGAGEIWHQFVLWCIAQNYAGVENLSLIPGTVGAAPMQNIGAYGVEIKEVFYELEALNMETLQLETFDLNGCHFGYRESIFKHEAKGKYIITTVTFRLNKTPTFHINYGDIQKTLFDNNIQQVDIKAISDAVIQIRQSKLPNPAEIGNAGSFFKNPEIPLSHFEELKAKFPDIIGYPVTEKKVKVPAGWLIEQAGWKGFRDGQIGVHSRQALVLVNYGGGQGADIQALSQKIQTSVFEKYGINLSTEVNFV